MDGDERNDARPRPVYWCDDCKLTFQFDSPPVKQTCPRCGHSLKDGARVSGSDTVTR